MEDVIKAPSELKKVKQELKQVKQDNETLSAKLHKLTHENGRLNGELSAKGREG